MASLFEIGLVNAALATILAIIVWLVTRVWRQPVLVHALWVVVLVKLITPPMLTVPWELPDTSNVRPAHVEPMPALAGNAIDIVSPPPQPIEYAPLAPLPETSADAIEAAHARPLTPSVQKQTEKLPQAKTRHLPPWLTIVATLWLAGSALFLIVTIIRLARFHRALARTSPATKNLGDLAEKVASRLRVTGRYRLRITEGRLSPLVWPIGRPTIVLARPLLAQLSPDETQTLLAHELAHLRRGDHWVRWLELAAVTIYWWHPVVWWARAVIRKTEEQACDAWVVGAFPDAAKRYAAALFTAVEFISESRPAAPLVATRLDAGSNLKERIENIMNGTCNYRLSLTARLSVLLAALVILPLSLRAVQAADDGRATNGTLSDAVANPISNPESKPESTPPRSTKRVLAIERALELPVSLDFAEVPLHEAMALLSDFGGVDVHLDPRGLSQEGVAHDTPVTIDLKNDISLKSALNLILEPLHLTFVIEDEVLKVTSERNQDATIYTIRPGMSVAIRVAGALPEEPIADVFSVEPGGTVALGPLYGRVLIAGLTIAEAEAAVTKHLQKTLEQPLVQITMVDRKLNGQLQPVLAQSIPKSDSNPYTSVRKKIVESKKQSLERLQSLAGKNVITAAELEKTKSEYEISVLEYEQAIRALKYNQLLVELAETEFQEALERNKTSPNSVSEFELRKLRIKVELAKVKMSAVE